MVQVTEITGGCGTPEVQRVITTDKSTQFSLSIGGPEHYKQHCGKCSFIYPQVEFGDGT